MEIKDYYNYKLCYVKQKEDYPNLTILYFTNNMKKQTGDDWDDAPYEHNSGEPYEHETDLFSIVVKTDWREFITPCTGLLNSPYSVNDINEGMVPWLTIPIGGKKSIFIKAGKTLFSVIDTIKAYVSDCEIYIQFKN